MTRTCTIPDCTGPHYAKGRCRRHYEAWRDTTDEKPRCSLDGCDRPVKARGWCATHYRQWLRGDAPYHIVATAQRPECSVDGCTTTAVCRGWCGLHYQRWRKHGSTADIPVKAKKKKAVDKLPAGWFKPTPRSSEKATTNAVERVDTLLPLESTSMAIVGQHAPAMRAKLAARFGADSAEYAKLADILGVAP